MGARGTDSIYVERMGIGGRETVDALLAVHEQDSFKNHSDINKVDSTNAKEVLKNKGDNTYENDTLEANDLDDIDTTGVIPEPGWVLQFDGTNFVPTMRKVYRSANLKTVQTGDQDYQSKFLVSVNFQRTGTYSFDLKANWSMNVNTTDIVGILTLGGQRLATITTGEAFRIEAKDTAGNDNDGRGTNQKNTLAVRLFANVTTIGAQDLELAFTNSTTNDSASLFDVSCVVREELQIIDNNIP